MLRSIKLLICTIFDLYTRPVVYVRSKCLLICWSILFPFKLICNMITYRNKCWHFDPTLRVKGVWCKDKTCACILLYAPFPLIWYAAWQLSEKKLWQFDPAPGAEGVYHEITCAYMVLYVPFPLISYATWILSKEKKMFLPFDPFPRSRVCIRTEYVLVGALCSVPFNLNCSRTTFRKKSFDLFTTPQGSRVCVRAEYVLAWCSVPISL